MHYFHKHQPVSRPVFVLYTRTLYKTAPARDNGDTWKP